MVVFILLVC